MSTGREKFSILAYDMSVRQLASQKEDLRSFRNQASAAAAVSGLIATVFSSLFGDEVQEIVSHGPYFLGVGFLFILLALCIIGSLLFSILVVAGWRKVNFEKNPNWILYQQRVGEKYFVVLEMLAKEMDEHFNDNENVITETRKYLRFSFVLAFAQIFPWVLLLVRIKL